MSKNSEFEILLKHIELYMKIIGERLENIEKRLTELEKQPTIEEIAERFRRQGLNTIIKEE